MPNLLLAPDGRLLAAFIFYLPPLRRSFLKKNPAVLSIINPLLKLDSGTISLLNTFDVIPTSAAENSAYLFDSDY